MSTQQDDNQSNQSGQPEVSTNETSGPSSPSRPGTPQQTAPAPTLEIYETDDNSAIIEQIRQYAEEIKCSDFHGKGTVEDYKTLFQAAGKIADDVKRIEMEVDIEGFQQFGQAADELSQLFESFTVKLQNLTIVDDTAFLNAISLSLSKIVNLSNVFGRFKKTVSATATIKIPKSIQDANRIISGVVDEVSCAMGYISYFVDPSSTGKLSGAELPDSDKKDIEMAVELIEHWKDVCTEGVSTAMDNNEDVVRIRQANTDFKLKTATLKKLTGTLRSKLIIS